MAGHWYDRDGKPRHYITGADGSPRPATLADARRNGWLPGYSAVDRMIHNHFLTEWRIGQAVAAARTLRPLPDEPENEFVRRINGEASRKSTEAMAEGKAIHAAIEASFAGESVPEAYTAHVSAVRGLLSDNFPGVDDWRIEETFACRDGYGGTIDIWSPSIRVFGDYKGADFEPGKPKKLAYTQYRQLASYRHGKGMDDARGFNIFVSRSVPGHVQFHEWTQADLARGWHEFSHALALWKSINDYDGSWT